MPPPAPRFACLAAAVLAPAAAVTGLALDSPVPGALAGAAGLAAGVLGWIAGASAAAPVVGPPTSEQGPTDPRGPAPLDLVEASLDDPVEELQTLVDAESGLFTQGYLLVALEARIAAARRRLRPVSIVMLDVVEGLGLGEPTVSDPVAVSTAIRATLREADTAGRLVDGRYVLVLEDTNETGAVWTVERVRSKLAVARPGCTVWAGVACYPAHGFTLPEILSGADRALVLAREWRQDRIEVAISD